MLVSLPRYRHAECVNHGSRIWNIVGTTAHQNANLIQALVDVMVYGPQDWFLKIYNAPFGMSRYRSIINRRQLDVEFRKIELGAIELDEPHQ